jgi:hypothetical protein
MARRRVLLETPACVAASLTLSSIAVMPLKVAEMLQEANLDERGIRVGL